MLLIVNGLLLSLDDERPIIRDAGILIEDDKIIDLGKSEELKTKYSNVDLMDVKGKLILPGMINTHMHLYSTFARGMDLKTAAPPSNFVEILEKLWWRLDNTLNEEDIYYSALYAIIEGIKNGTTTIFDHHASYGVIDGSLDIIKRAVKLTGIRANLSFEISDRHGPEKARKSLRENERYLKDIKKEDQKFLSGLIALHASFTLSKETLEKASLLAKELQSPFHLHLAEGRVDVEDSKKRGYDGIVDRLDKYNIWRKNTLAIHGVHLRRDELKKLSEKGVILVHNPESNMSNAVGAAPLMEAIKENILLGLGTDGYTVDMFESLKTANLLFKHEQTDPRAGDADIFNFLYSNNREIANRFFAPELGIIKKGAAADIIIVDYKAPTPIRAENIFYHLFFGLEGSMVDTTIVGGQVLMKEREVKVLDYERIINKIQRQAADFWKKF